MTGRAKYTLRHSLAGVGAGCLFVVTACFIELARTPHANVLTSLGWSQRHDALLWIIDLAPLVLGVAGAMLGRVNYRLHNQLENLESQVSQRTLELVTANEALEKQRDTFAQLAESLPVGIMRVHGELVHLNSEALKIVGTTSLDGYNIERFCDGLLGDYAAVIDMLQTHARLGRPAQPEIVSFRSENGTTRDLQVNCVVVYGAEVWVLNDVSEMVRIQRELRDSRASNAAMLAALPDTFATVNSNGTILSTYGTDRFCASFPDFHAGNILEGALSADEYTLVNNLMNACGQPGEVKAVEFCHQSDGDTAKTSWWDLRAVTRTDDSRVLIVRDITDRKIAEAEVQHLHHQYELMLECIGEGVYSIDANGICNSVNFETKRLLGYTEEEIIGRNVHDLFHHSYENGDPYDVHDCPIYQSMQGSTTRKSDDEVFWHKDGRAIPVEYIATPMYEAGNLVGAVISFMDITERRQLELQLRQQLEREHAVSVQLEAHRSEMESQQHELIEANKKLEAFNAKLERQAAEDGLTGLQNHIAFQDTLHREISRCQRYGSAVSLVMLDVDHFKFFNDTYGHPGGDEILREVGKILVSVIRSCDIAARYGGEEFAVILPETGEEQSRIAAERIRAAIEAAEWPLRPVTVSVGVATLDETAETPALLVANADRALYCSKHSGRNCVTHAFDMDAAMKSEASSRPYTDVLKVIFQSQEDLRASAQEQVKDVLLESYDRTILTWGRLLDPSEPGARGRSARVCELVERLSRLAGLNEEEVLYARWGTLLHNIGEISLMRTQCADTQQSVEERKDVLKKHPQIAYEFMMTVPLLVPAIDIPYCHHERWDGEGFPRALKGDEIPLTARLFAVANFYDKLVAGTSGHAGYSNEEVISRLTEEAGKALDPRAVRLLIKMLNAPKLGTQQAA